MDRESLAKKYNVNRLEDYVIEEFNVGKNEAETLCNEYFENSLAAIEKIEDNDIKVFKILIELLNIKKEFSFENNNFGHIIREAKEYIPHNSLTPRSENEEIEHLAKYVLDYYDFIKLPQWRVTVQLKRIRKNSKQYHITLNIISKSQIYFDNLNELQKFDDYVWGWSNFENGLHKIFNKHRIDKIEYESDFELKIKLLDINKNFEIKQLKDELKDANKKIIELNEKHEFVTNYHDKYYYNSQIIINNTFFGDNTPFLFNLFNFLKKNNLYNYGWSYFHSCMVIGNYEMILLNKPKKSNFIGRIFYHLSNYLILHFKENPMLFIKAKFLIDENEITDSFKNNHMKPNYDKMDDPELEIVDDFFEKQKKIYLKS